MGFVGGGDSSMAIYVVRLWIRVATVSSLLDWTSFSCLEENEAILMLCYAILDLFYQLIDCL